MPSLRADLAYSTQKVFYCGFVAVLPILRKAIPVADVHARQEVRYLDDTSGAALRQHRGEVFSTLQLQREPVRIPRFAI